MLSEQQQPLVLYASAGLVGAATLVYAMGWLNKRSQRIKPLIDLNNQTVKSPSGVADARVGAATGDSLKAYAFDDAKTAYEAFRRGARISSNGDCLGTRVKQADGSRPYVWLKYDTVIHRASCAAAGMLKLGLPKGQNTYVGIYAQNCAEWVIMEQACFYYDMVTVPLYDTLGAQACSFILSHTDIQLCFCDDNAKALKLLTTDEPSEGLKHIVLNCEPSDEVRQAAEKRSIQLTTLEALEKLAEPTEKPTPPLPSSVMTICYTSGTTGLPKGAVLTHANLIAVTTATSFLSRAQVTVNDTYLSFLPLAHMFERLIESACFSHGARVGFFGGDVRGLTDDFQTLQPTVVAVVPRVINRIYDTVIQSVSGGIKKHLFNMALCSKTSELQKELVVRHDSFWDSLVFSKIRAKMGGNVRLVFTGAAPLGEHVLTFIRAALGCVVLEGYGQTECAAACTLTVEGDHVPGTVGIPLPCVEIRLVDVPEMEYFAKDQAGEVLIRGPSVFKGYHKDAEKTAEALDSDGWLHTGDIGRWTDRGTLKIVDRKKHILKLAQGEYVAPEKIENIYLRSRFVGQMFVYGESLKTVLIAVVVPDPDFLPKECAKQGVGNGASYEELCKLDQVKKMIQTDMAKMAKEGGLHSFEQVKDFCVSSEQWTVENELLTPTMKTKRPEIKKKFADELKKMYDKQS